MLALGTVPNFHRTPGIEEHALTMKTLGDAILLRNRMLEALDVADNHPDEAERMAMLTVVVAGGGFAGAETAGAVNDLLREAIHFYPNLREGMLRIVLVHRGEVILPELSESLGRYAQTQLQRRGVDVRLKTGVAGYDGKELTLTDGTKITTRLVVWTAGITPSPLVSGLAVRHAAGPRAGEHLHADTAMARCMGARRLRVRAGCPESGQILSTHRATRDSPGRRTGGQYRGGNARPGRSNPSGSRRSACLPPSDAVRAWRRFSA